MFCTKSYIVTLNASQKAKNIMRAHPNSNEIRILRLSINIHLDDAITDGGVNFFLRGPRTTVEHKVPASI